MLRNQLLNDVDISKLSDDLTEDDFELCATRLEQHVGDMMSHLGSVEPELSNL